MYNLKNFNPREELIEFEHDTFVYDICDQYSLNEKEEKIWSYNVTENGETLPVIFQLIWFEKRLHISYSTEHESEDLRVTVSEIAHQIQHVLRQKTKAPIVLEQPIISDLAIYQNNCSDDHNVTVHAEIIKAYLIETVESGKQKHVFDLYGKDGCMLGEMLQEAKSIEFYPQKGVTHQLVIKQNLSKEQREAFLELVQLLGYAISYEEIETYDTKSAIDLFSSGLIQIEQVK